MQEGDLPLPVQGGEGEGGIGPVVSSMTSLEHPRMLTLVSHPSTQSIYLYGHDEIKLSCVITDTSKIYRSSELPRISITYIQACQSKTPLRTLHSGMCVTPAWIQHRRMTHNDTHDKQRCSHIMTILYAVT